MIMLLSAVVAPVYIACTNCAGVGSVSVRCPRCEGRGIIRNSRFAWTKQAFGNAYTVACPDCTRGLYKPTSKGSGRLKETCKVCKGKKKYPIDKSGRNVR